ncbi:MAG: hypothetical protein ACLFVO_12735 [Chloroflexaceae bacterium]
MTTHQQRSRRLLLLSSLISALLLTLSFTPVTRADENPNPNATWAAWGLAVDFPNQQLRVRFATYVGDETPQVLDSISGQDITSDCTVHGTLTFDGDYAIFDGQTYIECELPNWGEQAAILAPHMAGFYQGTCDCSPSASPFWISADLVLDPVAAANPVFDGSEVGFTFNLPSNGSSAKTRVTQSSGTFLSPAWTVNPNGNRMLVGRYGPVVEAIVSHFGGLQYLTDSRWKEYFTTQVTGNKMGQWLESPSEYWRTSMAPNYTMNTGSATVQIGYETSTGNMLHGKLRKLRVDPGCRGS